jgi:hypothetical protein
MKTHTISKRVRVMSAAMLLNAMLVLPTGACPLLGCSPSQQNNLDSFTPKLSSKPEVAWLTVLSPASSTEILCTSYQQTAVCVTNYGNEVAAAQSGAGLFALNSSGSVLWSNSIISATRSAPLQGTAGGGPETVVTDGNQLVAFGAGGKSLGPSISLHSQSEAFSLTLTDNGVVIIADKACGMAGYLTNGVIHASMQFRATIAGSDGCFAPSSMPAINRTLNRVYIAAQFDQPLNSSEVAVCRIYAVDIHRTMDNRMHTAWTQDYRCFSSTSHTTQDNPFLLLDNTLYFESAGPGSSPQSNLLALHDNGTSASVLFSRPLHVTSTRSTASPASTSNGNGKRAHLMGGRSKPTAADPARLQGLTLVLPSKLDLHPLPMLWVTVGGGSGGRSSGGGSGGSGSSSGGGSGGGSGISGDSNDIPSASSRTTNSMIYVIGAHGGALHASVDLQASIGGAAVSFAPGARAMGFLSLDQLAFRSSLLISVTKDLHPTIAAVALQADGKQISLTWQLQLDSIHGPTNTISAVNTSTPWQPVAIGESLLVVSQAGAAIGLSFA